MAGGIEIRIVDELVRVLQGDEVVLELPVEQFAAALHQSGERGASVDLIPRGVRVWRERDRVLGVVVEVAPHTRTVRWLAEDSKVPFGRGARYASVRIALPFVVLLLVLDREGTPTNYHQLYYRTAPLDAGRELYLPNLYNVANHYNQKCWVCLASLPGRALSLPLPARIDAIVDHVFTAAFNRSSEEHEGNSYWSSAKAVDPRLETMESWAAATRQNPLFPLEVCWTPAETTVDAELERMMNAVSCTRALESATDLAGLVTRARGRRRKRKAS